MTSCSPRASLAEPGRRLAAWTLSILVALAALGLAPRPLPAQDKTVPVPDPVALSADWWQSLIADEATLEARLSAFKRRLVEIESSSQLKEADRNVLAEARALLDRYVGLKARSKPQPAPASPARPRYSLADLLALDSGARERRLDIELQKREAETRRSALADAQKRVNQDKVKYLDMPSTAPGRLAAGLRLIRDRLVLSTGEEALRHLGERIDASTAEAQSLATLIEAGRKRLAVEPGDSERFEKEEQAAKEKLEQLRREAAHERLREASLDDTPISRTKANLLAQTLVHYEALIASAELEYSHAALARHLLEVLRRPGESTTSGLREQRAHAHALVKRVSEQLPGWRRATAQEQSAAAQQLAGTAGAESTLGKLLQARIEKATQTTQTLDRISDQIASIPLLDTLVGDVLVGEEGRLAGYVAAAKAWFAGIGEGLGNLFTASLFEINETPVTLLGLFRVIFIVFAAWWISALARRGLAKLMVSRDTMSQASLYTLGRVIHYVALAIGIFMGLSSIGIDFTKFALIVSALGIGLGFGLQAIFSNFVAGLIILFEKSLKVGDFVELESGVHGEVKEINIRSTLINTNDNIDILVPNSEFVNGRVTNWTHREASRRLRIGFGVAYGTDKELVRKAVSEAALRVPYTLTTNVTRRPQVWLVGFGESRLMFELVVWLTPEAVKRPETVMAAYTWSIDSALGENGIRIPFPQRDLHLRSGFDVGFQADPPKLGSSGVGS